MTAPNADSVLLDPGLVERALASWINFHSIDAKLGQPDYELANEAVRYRQVVIDADGDGWSEQPSILDLIGEQNASRTP